MKRLKLLVSLLLVALSASAVQPASAAQLDPPLAFMSIYIPQAGALAPGDSFQVIFSIYGDETTSETEPQMVWLFPACCETPAGVAVERRSASFGTFDIDAWSGAVWYDHPATITYTYTVLADGPIGSQLVPIPWRAIKWFNDETMPPPTIDLSRSVNIRRLQYTYVPLISVAPEV